MLVSFSVTNYKTFRDRAEWSMIASADTTREADNVVDGPFGLRLLKSAVVYGANASGKSTLVEALAFVKRFVRISANNSQTGDRISVEPFRLNPRNAAEPSEFELIFVREGTLYRYGFAATDKQVTAEWLYMRAIKKEVEIFNRAGQQVQHHAKHFGGVMSQLIRDKNYRSNALLLSYGGQFNNTAANTVLGWLATGAITSGLATQEAYRFTENALAQAATKREILRLLQAADLQIADVFISTFGHQDELPAVLPQDSRAEIKAYLEAHPDQLAVLEGAKTIHSKYDDQFRPAGNVAFSLDTDESTGTQKFFALTGPLLDLLVHGGMWVVDELDASLHPALVVELVGLFNSKEHNPHGAQLLFNTHDTNLLSCGQFRRDQIWFTERDRYGAATLYSLSDFKTTAGRQEREDAKFERNYLQGRYGAIPFLGGFAGLPTVQPAAADE